MGKETGPASDRGILTLLGREDTLAGLMFMAIAVFGLWVGQDYPVGTAIRMGPGYVPRGLCWILLGLGAGILLVSLRAPGAAGEPAPRVQLRPLILIPLAVVVFALTLEWLGLAVATGLLILISALADKGQRPVEVVATLITLVLLTVAVFVWGVGIPLRIWPEF